MSVKIRRFILRANAVYLGLGALGGLFLMDIPGIVLGRGPAAPILAIAPNAGIGLVEAHGLAFILSMLLWRAAPGRSWHVTGAVIGLLLGTANLVFWQIFIDGNVLAMGYVTTALHWTFAAVQSAIAILGTEDADDSRALHRAVTGGVIRHF